MLWKACDRAVVLSPLASAGVMVGVPDEVVVPSYVLVSVTAATVTPKAVMFAVVLPVVEVSW